MAKILVIDDESSVRDLLETVLRKKGYEVVLASRGQKGIELYRQEYPDLTIVDLKMPEMDGLAVLRELLAIDSAAPVVMLTGFATEEAEREARTLGAMAFLRKGFSLHELGVVLKRILPTTPAPSDPSSPRMKTPSRP